MLILPLNIPNHVPHPKHPQPRPQTSKCASPEKTWFGGLGGRSHPPPKRSNQVLPARDFVERTRYLRESLDASDPLPKCSDQVPADPQPFEEVELDPLPKHPQPGPSLNIPNQVPELSERSEGKSGI